LKPSQKSNQKLNRNGIPVFDKGEDLFSIFSTPSRVGRRMGEENSDHDREQNYEQNREENEDFDSSTAPALNKRSNPNDRNGLPILSRSTSLSRLFSDKAASRTEEEEDFPTLLEQSLRGKNEAALLSEKREKDSPDPVPLKKRLKRYPPPEEELDLHGDTAARALVRSESFVRTAWRAGKFTLTIVVGKGLHSEFGAVLPDVVEDLLVRLKKEGVVLWFEWDRKRKSQSGAVIAYLKQF
jgi:DNA-nicking Smr family endonuclease